MKHSPRLRTRSGCSTLELPHCARRQTKKGFATQLPDASGNHPDWPGELPICGMALEPMDIFAEVKADHRIRLDAPALLDERGALASVAAVVHVWRIARLASRPTGSKRQSSFYSRRRWSSGAAGPFRTFLVLVVNRSPNMFTLIGLGTALPISTAL